MDRHRNKRSWRLLAAAGAAALVAPAAVVLTSPASAEIEELGGVRDVRAFACPPGQIEPDKFDDVEPGFFRLAINCIASPYEVTQGTGDGNNFSPLQPVPRFSMAVFLARVAEQAGVELDTADFGFTDIGDLPQNVQDAINGLANAGVAQGKSPTIFDPSPDVQRDQMASFLTRLQAFLAEEDGDGGVEPFPDDGESFSDVGDDNVHQDNVEAIRAGGVTAGTSENMFNPGGNVTRQQMALFLGRQLDGLAEDDALTDAPERDNEVLAVTPSSDRSGSPIPAPSGSSSSSASPSSSDSGSADPSESSSSSASASSSSSSSASPSSSSSSSASPSPSSSSSGSPEDDGDGMEEAAFGEEVEYEASELIPGTEYRITLIVEDQVERDSDGTLRFTEDDGDDSLADPGETSAFVNMVDDEETEGEQPQSVTGTSTSEGDLSFTVTTPEDASEETSVIPFVYANVTTTYVSFSPRLELAPDLLPVEEFGTGATATFSENGGDPSCSDFSSASPLPLEGICNSISPSPSESGSSSASASSSSSSPASSSSS